MPKLFLFLLNNYFVCIHFIYPNPVTEKEFNIELSGLKDSQLATVNIYNFNGRNVLHTKAGLSTKINHNLATGLYFIHININEQNFTKKLIIE